MTDLFEIPESQPPRLEQLRRELADLERALLAESLDASKTARMMARVRSIQGELLREEQRLLGRGD